MEAETLEQPVTDAGEVEAGSVENNVGTLAADTLRGDVRDSVLAWVKALPKPWHQMNEVEQRDIVDATDRFARTLITDACRIVAAAERVCITATLGEYKEKNGIEAKLKLPATGEVVSALHQACGRDVLIVTSGVEALMGQQADAVVDADEPKMPGIGEEYVGDE